MDQNIWSDAGGVDLDNCTLRNAGTLPTSPKKGSVARFFYDQNAAPPQNSDKIQDLSGTNDQERKQTFAEQHEATDEQTWGDLNERQ